MTTVLTVTVNAIKYYSIQPKPYVSENNRRGNWMSHAICCPHATVMLTNSKCISPSVCYSSHMVLYVWALNLPQSWRGKLPLHWAMLFIKLCRNPVACLSGQSTSRSSIIISATALCCDFVMFGVVLLFWMLVKVVWGNRSHRKPTHFSAALAHMVTEASTNKNKHVWNVICYRESLKALIRFRLCVSQWTWTVWHKEALLTFICWNPSFIRVGMSRSLWQESQYPISSWPICDMETTALLHYIEPIYIVATCGNSAWWECINKVSPSQSCSDRSILKLQA